MRLKRRQARVKRRSYQVLQWALSITMLLVGAGCLSLSIATIELSTHALHSDTCAALRSS